MACQTLPGISPRLAMPLLQCFSSVVGGPCCETCPCHTLVFTVDKASRVSEPRLAQCCAMSATSAVAHFECVCVEGHALMTVENKAVYQKSLLIAAYASCC